MVRSLLTTRVQSAMVVLSYSFCCIMEYSLSIAIVDDVIRVN